MIVLTTHKICLILHLTCITFFMDSFFIKHSFLRHLEDESKKNSKNYNKFFIEFGHFLKEGVVTDFNNKNNIAKLLRFETSARAKEDDLMSSFDDYISRSSVEQDKTIYYLCAPNRALAEASPYYEIFKRNKTEVLFLYTPIDEFVMGNL